jgi:hypothetical protein
MREGYEVYEAYLDGHEGEIEAGEPFVLEVRDCAEMTRKVVRARVARSSAALPEGQPLWVRGYNEEFLPEPWAIQVEEELDQDIQPLRGDIARGEMPEQERIY